MMALVAPPSAATAAAAANWQPGPAAQEDEREDKKPVDMAGGGDANVVVKDEHGQDINCVVCGDKSSGKHYGQYTCEGDIGGQLFPPDVPSCLRREKSFGDAYKSSNKKMIFPLGKAICYSLLLTEN